MRDVSELRRLVVSLNKSHGQTDLYRLGLSPGPGQVAPYFVLGRPRPST